MPLSVIIELEHDFPLPSQHFGRQFQGWFFDALKTVNPELADRFHNSSQTPPYTISTAFPANHHALNNSSEKNLSRLRLTILDDSLRDFFVFEFLPQIDSEIKILWMDFQLGAYIYSQHVDPRAGFIPYAELGKNGSRDLRKKVILEFVSPTVFRSGTMDIPLPGPDRIFYSLHNHWNEFAPQELKIEPDWRKFADDAIVINRIYHLKTERLRFAGGQRGAATGFVGRIELSLLPPNRLPKEWSDYYSQGHSIFQALAAFSFFSGVGARTTIGMGQTYHEIS
jgi:CRISPR-associated endoribonuclease Cas6